MLSAVLPDDDSPGDRTTGSFGPLGTSPSIEVRLPLTRSEFSDQIVEPSASVAPIPDGFLVRVGSSSSGYFAGSMFAAIDFDGTVRWVRCFPDSSYGFFVASAATGLTSAYIEFAKASDDRSAPPTRRVDRISLADGSVTASLADMLIESGIDVGTPFDLQPLTSSPTAIAFGRPSDVIPGSTDRLILFDLTTEAITEVPYPPSYAGGRYFELGAGDTLVMLDADGLRAAAIAYVDGTWNADPDVIASLFSPRADFNHFADPALQGFDGAGRVLWTEPSIITPPREGFTAATSGDVSIVRGCTSFDQSQGCIGAGLWGVDTMTGNLLWHLEGLRNVSAVADGSALISEPILEGSAGAAWLMIDLSTGEQIDPTQRWADPTTFETQCCGGGEFVHVRVQDGIVFAVNGDHIAIWYPAAESMPTVTVALP